MRIIVTLFPLLHLTRVRYPGEWRHGKRSWEGAKTLSGGIFWSFVHMICYQSICDTVQTSSVKLPRDLHAVRGNKGDPSNRLHYSINCLGI